MPFFLPPIFHISHTTVSYTFLSTVAVHPLDVTLETSVEFAQVADLVVEGAYYSYHEFAFSYFV